MSELRTTFCWLRDRPQLLRMIVKFNTQLAATVDPGHVTEYINRPVFENLVQSTRNPRRLSKTLSKWCQLAPDGYYDFQPMSRRFALLDYPVLKRLMVFVGAAVTRTRLSRIIRRDERNNVKAALGEDAFDFAVRRAGFLAGETPATDLSADVNAETVARVGWKRLELCLAGESTELTRRLELKLPPEISLDLTRDIDSSEKESAARLMKKILITEIQPDLALCFT